MPKLSIILPTCNRADLLRDCLKSIRQGVRIRHEVIVVDGASTDHTPALLQQELQTPGSSLRIIREPHREGFVRAANKGFRAARGQYLIWLNDDARLLPSSLDQAVQQLETSPPDVGLLALFHRVNTTRSVAYETIRMGQAFKLLHVRGTLYANFGLGRRQTFEQLGHFDERFSFNGADPDFSLKIWHAGLKVVPAWGALVDHDEHDDDRRTTDTPRGTDDNLKLFEKWDLPPKNPAVNDFDPVNPCTLRGQRSGTILAA